MSGIQVHTSSPINANSDASPRATGAGQADDQQRPDSTTIPTKTIANEVHAPQWNPPPPMPGQVPSMSNQDVIGAGGDPRLTGFAPVSMPSQQTTSSLERQDLSNPPGYQQQQTSFQDRPIVGGQTPSIFNASFAQPSGGMLDTGVTKGTTGEEGQIWDTAKSWAKAAGEKLSTTEASVWKMVNGEK